MFKLLLRLVLRLRSDFLTGDEYQGRVEIPSHLKVRLIISQVKGGNIDKRELLRKLPKEKLVELVYIAGKDFWNVQGNWIYWVENNYGLNAVGKADAVVFAEIARVETYRVKELFNLGNDVPALMRSLELVTYTGGLIEPEFREVGDKHLSLYIPRCGQDLRKVQGHPELPCKEAGLACFTNQARVINPKFKVSCIFCPPDKHPEDVWCAWMFELED